MTPPVAALCPAKVSLLPVQLLQPAFQAVDFFLYLPRWQHVKINQSHCLLHRADLTVNDVATACSSKSATAPPSNACSLLNLVGRAAETAHCSSAMGEQSNLLPLAEGRGAHPISDDVSVHMPQGLPLSSLQIVLQPFEELPLHMACPLQVTNPRTSNCCSCIHMMSQNAGGPRLSAAEATSHGCIHIPLQVHLVHMTPQKRYVSTAQ